MTSVLMQCTLYKVALEFFGLENISNSFTCQYAKLVYFENCSCLRMGMTLLLGVGCTNINKSMWLMPQQIAGFGINMI